MIQKKLRKAIEQLETSPSLTIDIWSDSSQSHSYLGTTIHFVRDSKLLSGFLGLRLITQKTGRRIKAEVEDQLGEFGLSIENVFKIITDGASNMKAAFQETDMSKYLIIQNN